MVYPLFRLWNTFYTEDDVFKLSILGISHLRIPVGYWLVDVNEDEEPFPLPPQNDNEGQRFYLKRLIKWAEKFELKVMQSSQNKNV
jgi:glucan 1,3-beta-glucosidase